MNRVPKLTVIRETLTEVTNTLKSTHLNTETLRQNYESMRPEQGTR